MDGLRRKSKPSLNVEKRIATANQRVASFPHAQKPPTPSFYPKKSLATYSNRAIRKHTQNTQETLQKERASFLNKPEEKNQKETQRQPSKTKVIKRTKKKIKSSRKKKVLVFLFVFVFLCLLVASGVFAYLTYRTTKAANTIMGTHHSPITIISTAKNIIPSFGENDANILPLKGQEDQRVNVLLLGKAPKDQPSQNLTDTIMIASINTKTYQTALISLPRDLYVNIPNTKSSTKINALYHLGRDNQDDPAHLLTDAVEEITGLPIHYWVAVDYNAFRQVIDALGGVNVEVTRDIYDPNFPGPNYSYEVFKLDAGFHTLDGDTALKYVRERHSDPEGDFGRAKRQQQVIQSVRNRVFSTQTLLNPFKVIELLEALDENIKTNISLEEISGFIALIKKLDTQNINTVVVDAWKRKSLLRVTHVYLENGQRMFALVPRAGNYSEIKELSNEVFDLKNKKNTKEKIKAEEAKVKIINKSGKYSLTAKIRTLLIDLGISDVIISANASGKTQTSTQAIDHNTKKHLYTLNEIITRVPATKVEDPSDVSDNGNAENTPDITLILGEDIIERYTWDEVSIEEYRQSEEGYILPKN